MGEYGTFEDKIKPSGAAKKAKEEEKDKVAVKKLEASTLQTDLAKAVPKGSVAKLLNKVVKKVALNEADAAEQQTLVRGADKDVDAAVASLVNAQAVTKNSTRF